MRRALLALALLAAACGGSSAPSAGASAQVEQSCAGVAGKHHAYVEIVNQGAVLTTSCVGFDGASIDGATLMRRSLIEWSTQTDPKYGLEVCQVDSLPAHFSKCLAADYYWSDWLWSDGAWSQSQVGISQTEVKDREALGWVWTSEAAGASPSPPPPPPAF